MSQSQFRIPLEKPDLQDRKERFAALNTYVTERGGWLTSIPGDVEVEMQCRPGSTLPDDLRGLGYVLTVIGETERIIPGTVIEKFVLGDDGTMQPLVAGSTRPVAQTLVHAGIARVKRYAFGMP